MPKGKLALIIYLVILISNCYGGINNKIDINSNEWKKVNLGELYTETCSINLDLDGDNLKEEIELKESGKYIFINSTEYIVNKYVKDKSNDNSSMFYNDYNENQYYIVDLNSDGILEIIHRTYQKGISPSTNKYTIYNFKNNDLKEIGSISIIGTIPDELYVKENTIKFEYWPSESPEDTIKEVICKLNI